MTQRAKEVSGLEGRSGRDNCTAELLVWAGSTEGLHWGISCCFTLVFIFSQLVTHPHCGIGKVPVTRGRDSSCAVAASVAVQGASFPLLPRMNFHVCGLHGREWLLVSSEARSAVPGG